MPMPKQINIGSDQIGEKCGNYYRKSVEKLLQLWYNINRYYKFFSDTNYGIYSKESLIYSKL